MIALAITITLAQPFCITDGCHYVDYSVRVQGEDYDQTWQMPAGNQWSFIYSGDWQPVITGPIYECEVNENE